MTYPHWGLRAMIVLSVGVLTGCGSLTLPIIGQGKTHTRTVALATPQVAMTRAQIVHKYTTGMYKGLPGGLKPKWGPGTVPENVAALYVYATTPKLNGGGDFPDLTANAPGAPKVPPFSLAPYPKNGAIRWADLNAYDFQSWAVQGAQAAAKWMMADEGNDPMTSWQYLNPGEPVIHGAAYKKGITSNGAGFTMDIAYDGFTGGYGYAYDAWATILGIGDAAEWTHLGLFHTPPSAMIGPGQQVLHEEEVTVELHHIGAGSSEGQKTGHYWIVKNGPTDILMADIKGLGWRVLDGGSIPATPMKVAAIDHPSYLIPKGAIQ